MSTETSARPALTMLSEEEQLFRDAVREFAQGEILPRAHDVSDTAAIPALFGNRISPMESPIATRENNSPVFSSFRNSVMMRGVPGA